MSSPERTGRSQTRVAILEAARSVLDRKGYFGAGLEEVARQAGVSRKAVYLHFGSKAQLFSALLDHVSESLQMGERLQRVADASCGEEALERWVRLNAEVVPRILDIVVQLDAARRSEPEAESLWRGPVDDRRAWCMRITRRIAGEGRLAAGWTHEAAADLLWATTMPGVFENLVIERRWTRTRYVQHMLTTLRRALLAD